MRCLNRVSRVRYLQALAAETSSIPHEGSSREASSFRESPLSTASFISATASNPGGDAHQIKQASHLPSQHLHSLCMCDTKLVLSAVGATFNLEQLKTKKERSEELLCHLFSFVPKRALFKNLDQHSVPLSFPIKVFHFTFFNLVDLEKLLWTHQQIHVLKERYMMYVSRHEGILLISNTCITDFTPLHFLPLRRSCFSPEHLQPFWPLFFWSFLLILNSSNFSDTRKVPLFSDF